MLYQLCSQELDTVGGATDSIFPRAERLLLNGTDYQKALEEIGSKKDMTRYESLMDFLFCEVFSNWRSACFRFYLDRKRPLRDRLCAYEVFEYDAQLVVALEVAKAVWKQKLVASWSSYREIVAALVAA